MLEALIRRPCGSSALSKSYFFNSILHFNVHLYSSGTCQKTQGNFWWLLRAAVFCAIKHLRSAGAILRSQLVIVPEICLIVPVFLSRWKGSISWVLHTCSFCSDGPVIIHGDKLQINVFSLVSFSQCSGLTFQKKDLVIINCLLIVNVCFY